MTPSGRHRVTIVRHQHYTRRQHEDVNLNQRDTRTGLAFSRRRVWSMMFQKYLVNILLDFRSINSFEQTFMSDVIHIRTATKTGGILSQRLDSTFMISRQRL